MQGLEMVFESVTARKDACLVAIYRLKIKRSGFMRVHLHVQVDQGGVVGAFEGAFDLV